MKSIDTMTSEYIRLEQECAERMYPFDMFTDGVRARWSTMSDAGKRIHLSRGIRCCKTVLSIVDPDRCPVCGRDLCGVGNLYKQLTHYNLYQQKGDIKQ